MKFYYILFLFCMYDYVSSQIEFGSSHTAIGFKKEIYENCGNNNNHDCKHYADPHDMRNYIHSSKTMSTTNYKNCHHKSPVTGCENCASYMQRFVGLFLGATGLKNFVLTSTNSKLVNLNLVVKRENLEVLQTFVENGKIDLAIINKALTDIFTPKDTEFSFDTEEKPKSQFEALHEFLMNILRQIFSSFGHHFSEHPVHLVIICVTSVFGITLWQIIKTRSYKLLSFSLFFIIFASGFAWNWIRLYKIADVKRFTSKVLNAEIPIYCRPDQMTWYQYMFYYSSYERECQKYFENVMIDPIVDVPPTIVLAETITFIFYPAERLGTAIGGFAKELIHGVPWPYNLIIVPLILIFVGIFFIVMMIILTNGRLRLNVFPFSSLEISSYRSCNRGLCSATPRQSNQLIEEIPPSVNKSLLSKLTFKEANPSPKRKQKPISPVKPEDRIAIINKSSDGSQLSSKKPEKVKETNSSSTVPKGRDINTVLERLKKEFLEDNNVDPSCKDKAETDLNINSTNCEKTDKAGESTSSPKPLSYVPKGRDINTVLERLKESFEGNNVDPSCKDKSETDLIINSTS